LEFTIRVRGGKEGKKERRKEGKKERGKRKLGKREKAIERK